LVPHVHELEMAEFEAKLPQKPLVPPPPPDHGMALLADPAGLRVERLASGGRGEAAGVKPGMVITRINNIALTGVSEPIAAQIVGNLSLEATVKLEMTDGTLITLVLLDEGQGARIAERVPAGSAGREFVLRDLIHDHPQAMPVHVIDASLGRVFTVAKEFYVPSVGYIDVLLADERGRLIVVECKLWSNPQARREVVGQILD
jgi:hypothetical protein